MRKSIVFMATLPLMILLALSYQNCGSHVGFEGGNEAASVAQANVSVPPVTPDTPTQTIIANCKTADHLEKMQTVTRAIVFDDTKVESGKSNVCPWGVGDNLPMGPDTNRARYEQVRNLNLPANAVVCDLSIAIAKQKIVYDDVFALLYNGRVLASNDKSALLRNHTPETNLNSNSGATVPLYKFDWLKFRDTPFQNSDADDYCLGSDQHLATCKWPLTQQTGDIVFDFEPELLVDIGKRLKATEQAFTLLVTGDNDPSTDCYHSTLNFNVEVKYYLQ